jgi:hypothetical protein
MIADAELNPIAPRTKAAATRLRTFHRIVAEHRVNDDFQTTLRDN